MPNPMMAALKGFKRTPVDPDADQEGAEDGAPEGEPLEDPRAESKDGMTMFLDKDMFPAGCKVGSKVTVTGTIESMGSKIGVVPEEIKPVSDGSGDEYSQD